MLGRRVRRTPLTVKLRDRGSRTGVVIRAKTSTSIRSSAIRGGAFVAGQFRLCWFPGGQVEEHSGVRRVIEVAMEPPLVEGIVGEGCHRPVIVRKRLHGDVKSPHCGGDDRYWYNKEVSAPPSPRNDIYGSQMCAFTDTISESHRRIVETIALVPRLYA